MAYERLKELISSRSIDFDCIYGAVDNHNKERGLPLLCLINNITDYYLAQDPSGGDILFPIIHLPECEIWAKDLCIEFLLLKLSFTKNKRSYNLINLSLKNVVIPEGGRFRKIQENGKKLRAIQKQFCTCDGFGSNITDMVVCLEADFKKLPSIYEDIAAYNKIGCTKHGLVVNTNCDSYSLERDVKLDETIKFENIFLFHSFRGIIDTYQKNRLLRINQHGVGIKRCFVFSFSVAPFRLYQLLDNFKSKLNRNYTHNVNSQDSEVFLTFSKQEMDVVFDRKYLKSTFIIDEYSRNIIWDETMSLFLEGRPSNIRERNICTLCLSDFQQVNIEEFFSGCIDGFEPELCSDFFRLISYTWEKTIFPQIINYIGTERSFALVSEWNLPEKIVKTIQFLFSSRFQKKVKLYTLSDLKVKKENTFKTNINESRIVIMRYRSPNGFYHQYPNSFDSICLSEGQSALEIIDKMLFDEIYDYDSHKYQTTLNDLLYSKFRKEKLGWKKIENIEHFHHQVIRNIDLDDDISEIRTGSIEKCEIIFGGSYPNKKVHPSQLALFKINGELIIKELREFEFFKGIEGIQLLEDLYNPINDLIDRKLVKELASEQAIRRNPKYDLTKEEIESKTELWKVILKHKVEHSSVVEVYEEIHPGISPNAFNMWLDFGNPMILPRSWKDQKALLTYLDLWSPNTYFKVLSLKKSAQRKGSRDFNFQIEKMLCDILSSSKKVSEFCKVKSENYELFELLSIESDGDLQTLLKILTESIDIKPFKEIRLIR